MFEGPTGDFPGTTEGLYGPVPGPDQLSKSFFMTIPDEVHIMTSKALTFSMRSSSSTVISFEKKKSNMATD